MDKTIKCAICEMEFLYNDKNVINPLNQPFSDGAKYFYDLWHFNLEKCPQCGYVCKDISKTYYKDIVKDEKYLNISQMDLINDINDARPNNVELYLKAGYYYESIGDVLNNIKCLLQAGDLLYGELLYWDEYVLDNSDSVSAIMSKSKYNEIKKFADYLFNSAMDKLETYVKNNPQDIDSMILLAGSLCDGDKIQAIKGTRYLNHLNNMHITIEQKEAINFLFNSIV